MPTQQSKPKTSPRPSRASGEPIQIIHGGRPNVLGYADVASRAWPTAGQSSQQIPNAPFGASPNLANLAQHLAPVHLPGHIPSGAVPPGAQPWQAMMLAQASAATSAAQAAAHTASLATVLQAQSAQTLNALATTTALQTAQAQAAAFAAMVEPSLFAGNANAPYAGNIESFSNTAFGNGAETAAGQSHGSPLITPAANIQDEGSAYLCTFDVPGVTASDVSLTYANGILFVQAVRNIESDVASILQAEQSPSQLYRRALQLPGEVTGADAEASLRGGVLAVRLPKAQPTQPPSMITVKE